MAVMDDEDLLDLERKLAIDEWHAIAIAEIQEEIRANNQLAKFCRYITFVSRSNGKHRKERRYLREIQFLVYNGKTIPLPNRLDKKMEWKLKDIFPEELVADKHNYDWYGAFIQALREMPLIAKYPSGAEVRGYKSKRKSRKQ